MPTRIQRQRTKGWKMPPNTVYVGRPSKWGNPYSVGGYIRDLSATPLPILIQTPRHAVIAFTRDVLADSGKHFRENAIRELRGKDLACWCPLDQDCHAEILLEIANQIPDPPSQPTARQEKI